MKSSLSQNADRSRGLDASECWHWNRKQIESWQLDQFNRQLDQILPENKFYSHKLREAGLDPNVRLTSLSELSQWPMTTKNELCQGSAAGEISLHHTYPAEKYSRLHRTSGTRGQPLMILDTTDDWQWWSANWQHVLTAANVSSHDRVFLAFSFGPFIGFWSAHQACVDRGAMVIPGGGLSTLSRLEFMKSSGATVVCCTPTYALHMAEVAAAEQFSLDSLGVRCLIVAGESGGSVVEVRNRITAAWQADIVDHAGATEVGPWGFGWPDRCGLHVNEASFIAEIIPWPESQRRQSLACEHNSHELTDSTQIGELVLTSLGRIGAPVIRYRTGDIVRVARQPVEVSNRCNFLWLPEGAIGRADDMVTIRGVNIFPTSIERLVRSVSTQAEYQVIVTRKDQLDQLSLHVEDSPEVCSQIEKLLGLSTGLRISVSPVEHGSLPRSDAKSRRWRDLRA